MEIKNNYKSPLLLKNISITEALLKINPTPKEDNGQLNLSVSKNIKKITDNIFNILVKTSLSSDNKDIDISVTCSSTFEVSEDIEKEIADTLIARNTISIIFPFIRSYISTITSIPNMSPIVIPPININKLIEDQERNKQ